MMSEVTSGTSQSSNAWQKMQVAIDIPGYNGHYDTICLQVFGELVDECQRYKVGDEVAIGFTLKAREWQGKLYNNVDLIQVQPYGKTQPAPSKQPAATPYRAEDLNPDAHKDLPF